MKKIILFSAVLFITAGLSAQAPNQMNYQTVIRNNGGALVTNQPVGFKFSILQGSSNGTPVYVETQTATTNINGLASAAIGAGTPVTGTFAGIDWFNGPYFIETETDPTGGTNYSITGTSQLLSVPYALYAGSAGGSVGFQAENTNPLNVDNGTATQVTFNQINYSTSAAVYNDTTSTFTAPVAGNYHLDVMLRFAGQASAYPVYIDIYINGNYAKRFITAVPALQNTGVAINEVYDLNLQPGNTMQIYVTQNSGATITLSDNGSGNDSFWSVNKY